MTNNQLTDERLVKILSETQATIMEHNSRCVRGSVEVDARLFESMLMELQERRKAEMGSEPVAYADPQSFDNFKSNGGKNAACTKEWMWRDHSVGLIPLYRHAQPAPASGEPAYQYWCYTTVENSDGEPEELWFWKDCEKDFYERWKNAKRTLYRHAQPAPERDQVRSEHAEWSQVTFGNVGPIGPLKHLRREVLEVIVKPHDLTEWADMQFLMWDAQRRAGITDEQITLAMIEKLAVNKLREWPEPKDGEPRLHIKAQSAQVMPEKINPPHKKVDRCDVCTEGARGGCGTCIFNGNFE